MDGFKKRLNDSVQLKLSVTLSVAILVVAVVAGIFSFLSALDEAHELQDDLLRQIAQLVDQQPISNNRIKNGNEESRVIIQTLGERNPKISVDDGGQLSLPVTLADGLHTLNVNGETFRVLVKTSKSGERIAVAQESGFRNEIARDGALRTLMPFLILVPVLLLIVTNLIRKMFLPIEALSKEIDQRGEQEFYPIKDSHLPIEVRPFVAAINHLLTRVGQSMESQRRFVADAAHELRSPLTALSLQAERLADAEMSDQAHDRLRVMRQGIERSRNLLDQLLSLAKAQSADDLPKWPVSIQSIYRRVLEDLMPLAEAKHIDIGVEGTQDSQLMVNELDMIAIIKNLVDNAIRYTPEGGRIDLSVNIADGHTELHIKDNGPGIPLAQRDRIFDPFYRVLGSEQIGSGLGLSIVQAVANRIGAEIHLDFTDQVKKTGLSVTILIPMETTIFS